MSSSQHDELRLFLFRGSSLEHSLKEFQDAGIEIGASAYNLNSSLLDETISPFSIEGREEALYMSSLYRAFYCLENLLRQYIRDKLVHSHKGAWMTKIPGKTLKKVEKRRDEAIDRSWLVSEVGEELDYADFGDLSDIIICNWEDFADNIPSQHWLKQRMDELESARNFTAHHRKIAPSEAARIYMYIRDWTNILGL